MTADDLRPLFEMLLVESGLPHRVERPEQRSSVEAWEYGPKKRNPAPKRPCIRCGKTDTDCYGDEISGSCETQRCAWVVSKTVPLSTWQNARNLAPMMVEDRGERLPLPCDPTGTDPMPAVSPGDSGFAVYSMHGRWKP